MYDILSRCNALTAERDFQRVRRWKKEHPGRKTIAYVPAPAPVEIIHAAGMLPVGLHGSAERPDVQHGSAFLCESARKVLEEELTGRLAAFDGLLVCDGGEDLCSDARRHATQLWVGSIALPHDSDIEGSVATLTSEYRHLLAELESLGGRKVCEADLRESIALFNSNREMTRHIFGLHASSPHLVSALEICSVMRAGEYLTVDGHTRLIAEMLDTAYDRAEEARDSIRIGIEGSPCEPLPLNLIRLVEGAGCQVVASDFALGRRWFTEDIPAPADPIEALARGYVLESRRPPVRRPASGAPREKFRSPGVDGVVILNPRICGPACFDGTLFARELEREGTPHIAIDFERAPDDIRDRIEEFAGTLRGELPALQVPVIENPR